MTEPKITRYQTTEYNRYRRVLGRLQEAYSMAKSSSLDVQGLCDLVNERVLRSADFGKMPALYKGKILGYKDALWDSMFRHDLLWHHYDAKRGVYVETWDYTLPYLPDEKRSAHLWRHSLKPFSSK